MRQSPACRECAPETPLWSSGAWSLFVVAATLLGSFFYVWLRLEPAFEYHHYGPFFYRQTSFFHPFLARPGGLASYAGIYLQQFNSSSLLGAAAFVCCAGVILVEVYSCLRRFGPIGAELVSLGMLLLLLLCRENYGAATFVVVIGLMATLAATWVYYSVPWRRAWAAALGCALLAVLLFLLAGFWAGLVFSLSCALYAPLKLKTRAAAPAVLFVSLVALAVATGVSRINWRELFNPWPTGVSWPLAMALYCVMPVGGLTMVSFARRLPMSRSPSRIHLREISLAGTLVLGWGLVWIGFDSRPKLLAAIDYYAEQGNYEAVLAAASHVKTLDDPAKTRLELALYHTGRLAEELFSFHDMTQSAPSSTAEECRAQSQLLLELGLINDAEHMAFEALVMEGERPDLLRLLARISLLKSRPEAAQVFLNVLSLVPFQNQAACSSWPAVERTDSVRTPANVLTKDLLHDGLPVGQLLEVQLALNPTNQMAFECAMANYLLERDLKRVIEHLQLLPNFHYASLPRAYEEALLLFQELERVKLEGQGPPVRRETLERFQQFKAALRQWKGREDGPSLIAANFGDTYWYYYASHPPDEPAETRTVSP